MQVYEQLEAELGRWCGRPDATVVCNSGTAALHLALEALRLPLGSEVLVPEFTFVACARAVVLAGLVPVFVDCDERLLMDVGHFLNYLAPMPIKNCPMKVVMPVHVYGRRCMMSTFVGVASGLRDADKFYVIEDLAEAHGVRPHPQTDAACWSFYRNKVIAGEEGGAVAFKNADHATLARSLRSQGYGGGGDWQHIPRGMNYRMTNAQAGLISESLYQFTLDGSVAGYRREIEGWYDAECPPEWRMPPRDVPWVYDLRIPDMPSYAAQLVRVKALQEAGIAARCGFKPMSSQEEFKNCRRIGDAKVASRMSREVIALPIQPGVTTRESVSLAFSIIRAVVG